MEWLGDANKQLKATLESNPLPTKAEVDELRDKLENMENWDRLNNIRVVGIPEGNESGDMKKLLVSILHCNKDTQPLEIDGAHRTPANPGERQRTIQAHVLRSVNRELILRTARIKSEFILECNHIMIFLDFSRATQLKRDKFRECKKALQEHNIKFALLYQAVLKIEHNGAQRRFLDSKKAMDYIQGIPK